MKRVIKTLLVFVMFTWSAIFANTFAITQSVSTYTECTTNFSDKQTSDLTMLHNFLDLKWSAIESKIPGSSLLVQNFAAELQATLNCNSLQNWFFNYSAFQAGFGKFLVELIFIRDNGPKWYTIDAEASQAILQLQRHFINMLTSDFDITKPLSSITQTHFGLNLTNIDDDLKNLDLNLDIDTDGQFDFSNNEFAVNIDFSIDAAIEWTNTTYPEPDYLPVIQNMAISAETSTNFDILLKENLFARLNDLDFDIDASQAWESMGEDIESAKAIVSSVLDEIKWKYINITAGELSQLDEEYSIFSFINPTLFLQKTKNQPLIEFYKSGDKWYGRATTEICNIIGNDYACENKIRALRQLYPEGYLILTKNISAYTLSTIPAIQTTNSNLQNNISRNSREITDLAIYSDNSQLSYSQNKLTANIKGSDLNLNLLGDVTTNNKTFELTIELPDEELLIQAEITYSQENNTTNLTMDGTLQKEWVLVWTFNLNNQEVITYLRTLSLEVPQDIISIEELEDLLP